MTVHWRADTSAAQPHPMRMAGGQHVPSSPLAVVRCAESHQNHTQTQQSLWAEVYNTQHYRQVIVKQ